MSTETENKAPEIVIPSQTVIRNDVSVEVKGTKILKGKRAETVYLAPEVTPENLSTIVKWIGDATLVNELASLLKRKFQNIWFNAVDETTGEVNMERFLVDAANFTATGMKLSEIGIKLDELQGSLTKIIMAGKWQEATPEGAALQADIMKLNGEIRAYMAMKEDRQRKTKDEEEAAPAITV